MSITIKGLLDEVQRGGVLKVKGGNLNYYKDNYYLSTFGTETKISKTKAYELAKEVKDNLIRHRKANK